MNDVETRKIEEAMKRYNIPAHVVVLLISVYGNSIENEVERIINGASEKEPTGIISKGRNKNEKIRSTNIKKAQRNHGNS